MQSCQKWMSTPHCGVLIELVHLATISSSWNKDNLKIASVYQDLATMSNSKNNENIKIASGYQNLANPLATLGTKKT